MTKPERLNPDAPPSICINGCEKLIPMEGREFRVTTKTEGPDGFQYKVTELKEKFCSVCGVVRMVKEKELDSSRTLIEG